MTTSPTVEEILADPAQLLHRADAPVRQFEFRQTTQDKLRAAAFIDGRTDIWSGPPLFVPFLAVHPGERPAPLKQMIFHMSFCGSTLLARVLDRPGRVLSLKEPNCLIDLANWKTALVAATAPDADFEPMLQFAFEMLARRWSDKERILVKPSSWANNLIEDIAHGGGARAVFVTIGRDRFLEAVLRGGRPRLTFTARLAEHLARFVPDGPTRLQAAIESGPDPIGKVARVALVAHDLQLRLFEHAIGSGRLRAAEVVDYADIEGDLVAASSRAAAALKLDVDARDIRANCDRWMNEHAKLDVNAAFSTSQRRAENQWVRNHHSGIFDSGLGWAEDSLGPAFLNLPKGDPSASGP